MKSNEEIFYDHITSYMHVPFVWKGRDPNLGLDCSSLVTDILKSFGEFPLHMQANVQYLYYFLKKKQISEEKRLGAICFYGKDNNLIRHCGIMINEQVIVESGGGNNKILTRGDAVEANARVRMRSYDYRPDFFEVIYPNYQFLR